MATSGNGITKPNKDTVGACPERAPVVNTPLPPTTSMPASARKSSLGNVRRGPQKYIPYRADDFQHGKKTGIAVAYVDHTDEFEPFEKVMSQADQRTPFRPQNTRKKRGPKTPVVVQPQYDDDDENGEMSMELDDSAYHRWLGATGFS